MGNVIEFRVPNELDEVPLCSSCGRRLLKMRLKMGRVMKWDRNTDSYEVSEDKDLCLGPDEMTCYECGGNVGGGEDAQEIN